MKLIVSFSSAFQYFLSAVSQRLPQNFEVFTLHFT